MEYLMTYGWALLVIVIVIAVLIYINPFRAPEQCVFDQAGFLCQKPVLLVTGKAPDGVTDVKGLIHATLVNGDRKTIVIQAISCIKGRTSPNGDIANTDSWPAYTKLTRTLGYQATPPSGEGARWGSSITSIRETFRALSSI